MTGIEARRELKRSKRPEVVFTIGDRHRPHYWLDVHCGWCGRRGEGNRWQQATNGCIVCGPRVDYLRVLLSPGSDALAFLRKIREQPGDFAARAAFSDWLEERGGEYGAEIAGLFRGGKIH